jgi:hypothetical protein
VLQLGTKARLVSFRNRRRIRSGEVSSPKNPRSIQQIVGSASVLKPASACARTLPMGNQIELGWGR